MKISQKISTALIALALSVGVLATPASAVDDAIESAEYSISGTSATVFGVAKDGILAVAITVSLDDKDVDIKTASVNEDKEFYYEFSGLEAGKDYVFKVADYAGGKYLVATEYKEEESKEEDASSETVPATGAMAVETGSASSTPVVAIIIGGVAVVAFAVFLIIRRVKAKKN